MRPRAEPPPEGRRGLEQGAPPLVVDATGQGLDGDGIITSYGWDFDGDGVVDLCGDVCLGTVIPESVPTIGLRPNRYALVDDDLIFDSLRRGNRFQFTTEDTAGCSCEQIIEELHLGKGHTKFGCSLGAMRRWIDGVSP